MHTNIKTRREALLATKCLALATLENDFILFCHTVVSSQKDGKKFTTEKSVLTF